MPQLRHQETTIAGSCLPAGKVLQNRYRINKLLGRGGMGAVYEATDSRLGHTVALKQALTEDIDLGKQFEREARLMAQLNHPVLPRVSDYFTEDNRAWFVMQHVEGSDLAEIMSKQPGPLPCQVVVAWADQLLDALIYLHAHDRRIVHRDIKPHNLKVTPSGRIVLLDFGLAKSGDSEGDLSHSIFGYSPRYAPLEQIQDLGTSPQSDIYALGATLYHLLTGVKPPDAVTRATALIGQQPNPLKPAHELNGAVGIELSEVLSRAMQQNPKERFGSAGEFREALRRIGRATERTEIEFVAHPAPFEANVVEIGYPSGSGKRVVAAAVVILIVAFGVFCRFYPWKTPDASTPEFGATSPGKIVKSKEPPRQKPDRKGGRP